MALALALVFVPAAACSSSNPDATDAGRSSSSGAGNAAGGAGGSTSVGSAPVGTAPVDVKATVTSERELGIAYRQGVARHAEGWVFSTNFSLFRTDDDLKEIAKNEQAIPEEWVAKGYNHVGDVDIVDGVIYAPVEQPDMKVGRQAMFRYKASTLEFLDGVEVAQHHASFVSVDPQSMIAYSTDYFDDEALLRYDVAKNWAVLPPLKLDRKIGHIQGGDVGDGAFWISTDDDHDGLYRVDLQTGHVQDIGSMGHADGEGEGIDVTTTPLGLLHVVSIDAAFVPVRFIELRVDAR